MRKLIGSLLLRNYQLMESYKIIEFADTNYVVVKYIFRVKDDTNRNKLLSTTQIFKIGQQLPTSSQMWKSLGGK
ncbi:hypothetical protein [Caldicellulosiruptor saccharolyticus]|uniref:hypothetical protein n=1 Tax=Caldicellulosiruptor saccharolyticus TaxID=44001 RepID=UPI0005A0A660|nr:hypothetical protein [Caldicellulosiruptor saccharolyticus]